MDAPDLGPDGNFLEIKSPDEKHAVFRRGHDLWVRSADTGEERPLTTDGEQGNEYGIAPDAMKPTTILASFGIPDLPPVVAWSPDSTRVLTHRTDQRGVREVHWVEARPADGSEPALRTSAIRTPVTSVLPAPSWWSSTSRRPRSSARGQSPWPRRSSRRSRPGGRGGPPTARRSTTSTSRETCGHSRCTGSIPRRVRSASW